METHWRRQAIAIFLLALGWTGRVSATTPTSFVTPTDTIPNFAQTPTIQSAREGRWADPSSWDPQRIPAADDIVLIPAFGTTLEIEESLRQSGIDPASEHFRQHYDTTCPFVSKVWDRGEQLGREGYTIVIHGKFKHEETQATQSHTKQHTRTLVVRDREEALAVGAFILGKSGLEEFRAQFAAKWSAGFEPEKDLERIAVVNQTTMLAEETQEVAGILRQAMRQRYGEADLGYHFADTNDTLCYATNWNQNATKALLEAAPDLAVIVGGYNSSNTSHLVEICSQVIPSYLIENSGELLSPQQLAHFDIHRRERVFTEGWLPQLPARIDWSETTAVVIMGLALSFLATIVPARRAGALAPVDVLRYE